MSLQTLRCPCPVLKHRRSTNLPLVKRRKFTPPPSTPPSHLWMNFSGDTQGLYRFQSLKKLNPIMTVVALEIYPGCKQFLESTKYHHNRR